VVTTNGSGPGNDAQLSPERRNIRATHLLQTLLATFLAFGSGIIALVGLASRRHGGDARSLRVRGHG